MHPTLRFTLYVLFPVLITYLLLARYNQTDLQFGPPDDSYSQALNAFAAQAGTDEQIITVAQYHYHVPMNRFKARIPLIGFAQQSRLPETALPLLTGAASQENAWLVTIGFPPASPDNAAERWLSLNTYKISDDWSDDSVRMVRYSTSLPTEDRSIVAIFDKLISAPGRQPVFVTYSL